MNVTRVKIDKYTPDDEMKAMCTVVLDDSLCIHQVRVVKGEGGLFVVFPNTGDMKLYKKSRRFISIVHPCTEELRLKITDAVLNEYNKLV